MKKKLFYIVIFLIVSLIITNKEVQNDVFYSIKIGEDILKYGVDMIDHYSFIGNLSYTYPHWLFDVLIYFVYSIGGFKAIYISTIVLSVILLLTLFKLNYNLSGNKGLSFLTIFFISYSIGHFITSRAQLISYILLSLILYSIIKIRETGERKYAIYIFLTAVLIANFHLAMWPFIFILFLPFIAQDLISIIIKKKKLSVLNDFNIIVEKSKLKLSLITFGVTLLSGFLTLNFLVPFTYFIKTYKGISMQNIMEHFPTTIKHNYFFYIILLILVILFLNKKTKIYLSDFFMISGLFLLTLLSNRSYALFAILGTFSFVRILNQYNFNQLTPTVENKKFRIILVILMLVFSLKVIVDNKNINYVNSKLYPVEAIKYIEKNLDYKNIRLYNEYRFGSYLLFKKIPVFIDSRADLYMEEFNKDVTIFKDYLNVPLKYREIFEKYKFTHAIVNTNSIIKQLLESDNKYIIKYTDEYFSIYERTEKYEEKSRNNNEKDQDSIKLSFSNFYAWYGYNNLYNS